MNPKCLFCYNPLKENEIDFHSTCSNRIFGQKAAPILPYLEDDLEKLAFEIIKQHSSVTGVQPKLSLHIDNNNRYDGIKRFTIVGLWGAYILKIPSPLYEQLPEVEDVTMHLANLAKIKVVPHSLVRLLSGNLAYITRRIDRTKSGKVPMEDMCQLTERLTEDKYHGSYEQIAKTILRYSATPGLDVVNFFEMVLFSFLTGNADMHLKNFSLYHQRNLGMVLTPAYDLVATKLVNPQDDEDLALTLNGKKKKIKKVDFINAFNTLGLEQKQQEIIFSKMEKSRPKWLKHIENSFMSDAFKENYKALIEERFRRLSK